MNKQEVILKLAEGRFDTVMLNEAVLEGQARTPLQR